MEHVCLKDPRRGKDHGRIAWFRKSDEEFSVFTGGDQRRGKHTNGSDKSVNFQDFYSIQGMRFWSKFEDD